MVGLRTVSMVTVSIPQPTITKPYRNPQVLSSVLSALGTLQPQALSFLNCLVTSVLALNYFIEYTDNVCYRLTGKIG